MGLRLNETQAEHPSAACVRSGAQGMLAHASYAFGQALTMPVWTSAGFHGSDDRLDKTLL